MNSIILSIVIFKRYTFKKLKFLSKQSKKAIFFFLLDKNKSRKNVTTFCFWEKKKR